jgi:hypothetical protein
MRTAGLGQKLLQACETGQFRDNSEALPEANGRAKECQTEPGPMGLRGKTKNGEFYLEN